MSSFIHLIDSISSLLVARRWQLVTAESCTGGLVASLLTEVAGSSIWFERGFITYSNLAKNQMLGVPSDLLEKYGAVSESVAAAMALGALAHSTGNVALSITGIAGPGGGSAEKPVGTVCFGWAASHLNEPVVKTQLLQGDRQKVRMSACQEALEGVLSMLKNIP